jgi:hypothetical protein
MSPSIYLLKNDEQFLKGRMDMLDSKKQTLGIVMGIVFAGAIIAGKFFAGNMIAQFLKDFLTFG